ncbi:MAG TPA: aconitate hydratase [Chloroflexota bacterium]|nr:aconitate hydratase [Chloroflexota bacterium]
MNLTNQLIRSHLVEGGERPGDEVAIKIDQVLHQDATGAMSFLQFEAMGFDRVKPRVVVQYADHQTLQNDGRHTDDHRFLESACRKFGAYFAKPGVGICHVVHLEQFSRPGESLLGSDSHTPHMGAVAMLAFGAGGIDVAVAMGGGPYVLRRPAVVRVELTGQLRPWSTAKDAILELLRRLTVKGGIGKAFEYVGPGVATLTVPERATIANMGTELGLTCSLFPSDEQTRDYFRRLGREDEWSPHAADPAADYDESLALDLEQVEPLVAQPSQPDAVVPIGEVAGTEIQQVMIGSCTNGSYHDLVAVARVLRGQRVDPRVTCVVFPGSMQTAVQLARAGYMADLLAAGAVVSEPTCGACPGYVHVPATGTRSLRSFNRNFRGRSGLRDDAVYLASPEVCAASAIAGRIIDPRALGLPPGAHGVELPERIERDRAMIIPPDPDPPAGAPARSGPGEAPYDLWKGPAFGVVPIGQPFGEALEAEVTIKLGDKISTDDITPAGAEAITFRTNVPRLAEYVFRRRDPDFVERAKAAGQSIIVGGEAYGQGSSREHAAIAPMYLGVRAVLVKSLARIHRANLINWGILPLEFADPADYDGIAPGDRLRLTGLAAETVRVTNRRTGRRFRAHAHLTDRERRTVLAGGVLAYTKVLSAKC